MIIIYFFLFHIFILCKSFLKFNINFLKNKNLQLRLISERRTENYPFSPKYFELYLKRLNSKNITIQQNEILGNNNYYSNLKRNKTITIHELPLTIHSNEEFDNDSDNNDNNNNNDDSYYQSYRNNQNAKSKHFEVIKNFPIGFKDVGGYHNVKQELEQCVEFLKDYNKYSNYNIRIPKGLILEGSPGTGKTLIAKALAGECNCNFIAVSGSDFQEKYVGVGSTRIKELFGLAKKNIPCIIFIDEIDALGRKRSTDGEISSSERDSTLNSLLVELDGFKNNTGIFLVAATNRIDLLDSALIRPGRIDKKIHIGLPDNYTRNSIIDIHIQGKPHDNTIVIKDLVDLTNGLSGAQIENLLNEAMLNALRLNKTLFSYQDIDFIMNKIMAGWQPIDHKFTTDIIDRIAIHEMGHAIVGFLSKHHSKMSKVIINLSSPKSPGYTVFEVSTSNIYVREALFEHLMILLSGRIAEELFYGVSSTTGAINDFEEALKLAQKMITHYGMGKYVIYPSMSEKYKELIDDEVLKLINSAYSMAEIILKNSKELILECSEILKREKIIKIDRLTQIIENKYSNVLDLKIDI